MLPKVSHTFAPQPSPDPHHLRQLFPLSKRVVHTFLVMLMDEPPTCLCSGTGVFGLFFLLSHHSENLSSFGSFGLTPTRLVNFHRVKNLTVSPFIILEEPVCIPFIRVLLGFPLQVSIKSLRKSSRHVHFWPMAHFPVAATSSAPTICYSKNSVDC